MGNINLILFICLFIPMSMMLLIFKGQSRLICGFLLIGMFVCVFSGEINGLIINEKAGLNGSSGGGLDSYLEYINQYIWNIEKEI